MPNRPPPVHRLIETAARAGDPMPIADRLLAQAGYSAARAAACEPLAHGNPVMSQVFRIFIDASDAAAPRTAVLKIPAARTADRRREAATGSYARELRIYQQLRDLQGTFQPRVYADAYDADAKTAAILLEDLGDVPQRANYRAEFSRDPELARAAMRGLAAIHRRHWRNHALGSRWWMRRAYRADIFNEDITQFTPNWEAIAANPALHPGDHPNVNAAAEHLQRHQRRLYAQLEQRPRTVAHGDLHTANMIVRRQPTDAANHDDDTDDAPRRVEPVLIDWQDAVFGGATSDVAKFLATTLYPANAAANFEPLAAVHHAALGSRIAAEYPYPRYRRDLARALLATFANYILCATISVPADTPAERVNYSLRAVAQTIRAVDPLSWL